MNVEKLSHHDLVSRFQKMYQRYNPIIFLSYSLLLIILLVVVALCYQSYKNALMEASSDAEQSVNSYTEVVSSSLRDADNLISVAEILMGLSTEQRVSPGFIRSKIMKSMIESTYTAFFTVIGTGGSLLTIDHSESGLTLDEQTRGAILSAKVDSGIRQVGDNLCLFRKNALSQAYVVCVDNNAIRSRVDAPTGHLQGIYLIDVANRPVLSFMKTVYAEAQIQELMSADDAFQVQGNRSLIGSGQIVTIRQLPLQPLRVVGFTATERALTNWLTNTTGILVIYLLVCGLVLSALSLWRKTLKEDEDDLNRLYQLQQAISQLPEPFVMSDLDSNITYVNEAFTEQTGYTLAEVQGKNPSILQSGKTSRQTYRAMWQALKQGDSWTGEFINKHKNGRLFWHQLSISPIKDLNNQVTSYISIQKDITDQKNHEEVLRQAANVFEYANEGIMITDPDGAIIDVNNAFCSITGYPREEIIGQNPRVLKSGRHEPEFYRTMWLEIERQGHFRSEVWNRRKNGEVFATLQTISAVKEGDTIRNYVALFSDITSLKKNQERLEYIAHYDPLTGLPNRALLADRLAQGMKQAQRTGKVLAVAYIDLDGFKDVNDEYGHHTGDELLTILAKSMQKVIREADTLARLGGDEFIIILNDLDDIADAFPFLNRVLRSVSTIKDIQGNSIDISASVGLSFYPQQDSLQPDQLIRQADQAMYIAKQSGKNRYSIFDAEQDQSLRNQHSKLTEISAGIANGDFVLFYQPKVNMVTGKVIGAEALVRWQHPEQGLLFPDQFLPDLQGDPLMNRLGEFVLESALQQIQCWALQGLHIPVSINVDSLQIADPEFMNHLRSQLARYPLLPPGCLEVEILESSALDNIELANSFISDCNQLGVKVALDDFGTGYSTLTHLKHLPASTLKIDKSFVIDMLNDPDDLAILDAVIGLAEAFQKHTLAEGVESEDHGAFLISLGCYLGQGYGIAKPMPSDQLADWIKYWTPPESWTRRQRAQSYDRPVLFMIVQHNAWVQQLGQWVEGAHQGEPAFHPASCQFGKWIETIGSKTEQQHPTLRELLDTHDRIHHLADTIKKLKEEEQIEAAYMAYREMQKHSEVLWPLTDSLLSVESE